MSYLIDTNVVSELIKTRPDPAVIAWLRSTDSSTLFLGAMVVGEVRFGIERLPQGMRRQALNGNFERWVVPYFADRVLSVDYTIAMRWAVLRAETMRAGRVLAVVDSLIAATAIVHEMSVVTRNVRDFRGLGIELINPWEP